MVQATNDQLRVNDGRCSQTPTAQEIQELDYSFPGYRIKRKKREELFLQKCFGLCMLLRSTVV